VQLAKAKAVELSAAQPQGDAAANPVLPPRPPPSAPPPDAASSSSGGGAPRKKSRWGVGAPPAVEVAATSGTGAALASALAPGVSCGGSGEGLQQQSRPHLALPESGLDGPALKQLKEQKEMQLLQQRAKEALVQAQSAAAAAGGGTSGWSAQLHEERLKEYSALAAEEGDEYRDTIEDAEATGGVIEGGTWEHRKRAAEMLKTAQQAAALTAAAAAGVSWQREHRPFAALCKRNNAVVDRICFDEVYNMHLFSFASFELHSFYPVSLPPFFCLCDVRAAWGPTYRKTNWADS